MVFMVSFVILIMIIIGVNFITQEKPENRENNHITLNDRWNETISLIYLGEVTSITQFHNHSIYVQLIDGSGYYSSIPQLDIIFDIIEDYYQKNPEAPFIEISLE